MANENMIVQYVLDPQNPSRLKIAIEIFKSYPEIKRKIIFDFVDKLEYRLKAEFPTFNVDDSLKDYEHDRYVGISITKHFWQDAYIHLQAQEWGLGGFTIGISKSKASENTWPELFEELNKTYGPGRRQQWWYYYRRVDNFADWKDDTLIELREPGTVDFFVDQFESIRSIAEPIIDSAKGSPLS